LLVVTDRPPNLETPRHYFRQDLTPNDAFFVRWHLAGVPTRIDLATFRLTVGGHVERPLALSVDDLRARFAQVDVVAVNQCAGNGRSSFEPRVTGLQWGTGALGNAKWTGVSLAELLDHAGLKPGAIDVTFAGTDKSPIEGVPAFVKSLPVARARAADVLVAHTMNEAPLPMLNGFPLRLVVPGYYSTYWVKTLAAITVTDRAFDGYWIAKAYRVPATPFADEEPASLAKETVPISRLNVRSLVVRPEPAEEVQSGRAYELEGIAFDGGSGIAKVEVSTDDGATWSLARLDPEIGKYSFRRWRATWTPNAPGAAAVLARATSGSGEEQRAARGWNRSGYMHNAIERTEVRVVA
jgi:DMSO/TMAO reductase YedYZ molybdopterin-dependent catalytic subunit